MTGKGDCFRVALNLSRELNVTLCHGVVIGTGGDIKGMPHCHAWCEVDQMVIDFSNGKQLRVWKDAYYAAGQINSVVRYEPGDIAEQVVEHGHYGPWHPSFERFL